MSIFDDREKAQESKYVHDQEQEFKAQARRNRLIGLWAAGLLGRTGEDADAYAKEVVIADFQQPGDADVLAKILTDLHAGGVDKSEHQIRRKMDELLARARDEVKAE